MQNLWEINILYSILFIFLHLYFCILNVTCVLRMCLGQNGNVLNVILINLFTFYSFDDGVSNSDCIVYNVRMISE
jgi:hypothetical protein